MYETEELSGFHAENRFFSIILAHRWLDIEHDVYIFYIWRKASGLRQNVKLRLWDAFRAAFGSAPISAPPVERVAGTRERRQVRVSWWRGHERSPGAVPEPKPSWELREADWNVRVPRAPWSSRRRDFYSRGLFWQKSPVVWNLQLYLVMSNHLLDSAKFRLWDISREYCSKAKPFFLTTSMFLKSIYFFESIGLFCELWIPFRKEGYISELEINSNAEGGSMYSRSQGHYVQQKHQTELRSLWDLRCS